MYPDYTSDRASTSTDKHTNYKTINVYSRRAEPENLRTRFGLQILGDGEVRPVLSTLLIGKIYMNHY